MINSNELLETVKELCLIDGISGDEGKVRDYIINESSLVGLKNLSSKGN